MPMTLDQLPLGETALVENIDSASDTLSQLMEMGLVRGCRVMVERVSPFGCPMAIRLKGSSIAIRRQDAERIFLAVPQTQAA
jgi:ferrous iron transport protein A